MAEKAVEGTFGDSWKMINVAFDWSIDKFSCIDSCKNVGDCLISPKLRSRYHYHKEDVEWHMELYPYGINDNCKGYLSLILECNADIQATATFTIFNNDEIVLQESLREHSYGIRGLGNERFIDRNSRLLSLLLGENDRLKINCRIKYTVSSSYRFDREEDSKEVLPSLVDDYEALFNDGQFSDATLISEGKPIKVHKCILTKRSQVFAAMFDSEMREKQKNDIEIPDIQYDVLLEMLRYVYSEKVNDMDTLVGELAIAADKYAIDGLKSVCEKTMTENLCRGNVIQCLQIAYRLHMDKLMKDAITYIITEARDVTKKPEFNSLPYDLVVKICQSLAERRRRNFRR